VSRFTLHHGDSREVLKGLADASVDSIVCDPPYHLTNKGGGPHNKAPNAYSRAQAGAGATGFMGMRWDGGDVAQDATLWAEALRVLKPGGYLLAFSGTRTYHRMTCAIEDAGFEVRDQIGWAFGSGFPKSHNGEWGGTALKPAWEPICMARKPLIGTVEANWLEHGTGALNIDGCRVQGAKGAGNWRGMGGEAGKLYEGGFSKSEPSEQDPEGRWPANLIHDGRDEVVALFPREAGAFAPVRGTEASMAVESGGVYGLRERTVGQFHGDTGSAARFFYCAKTSREDRDEGLRGDARKATLNPYRTAQCNVCGSKTKAAGQSEQGPACGHEDFSWVEQLGEGGKNVHPTVKPTDLMRYLCRLVTPKGGIVLDPFMGSGSTGKAAMLEGFNFIGIDLTAEYVEIARARIEFALRQGHQPSLLEAAA
jgi:site-specific DNA-methyltransferase (adenine-specific)